MLKVLIFVGSSTVRAALVLGEGVEGLANRRKGWAGAEVGGKGSERGLVQGAVHGTRTGGPDLGPRPSGRGAGMTAFV